METAGNPGTNRASAAPRRSSAPQAESMANTQKARNSSLDWMAVILAIGVGILATAAAGLMFGTLTTRTVEKLLTW